MGGVFFVFYSSFLSHANWFSYVCPDSLPRCCNANVLGCFLWKQLMWADEMRMEMLIKVFLTATACKMAYLQRIMIQSVCQLEWDMRWQCVWEWGFSCGWLQSLSFVCCTGLHPQGWTGRNPWEKGLVWNWSPLQGSKRNAKHINRVRFVELTFINRWKH